MHELQRVASQDPRLRGERVRHRREHQGQRRPQFVADVGEESGLRAIDLRQRLRASTLGRVGLDVRQRGGKLSHVEPDKAFVGGVNGPEWIQACNEQTGRPHLPLLWNGERNRLRRRPLPGAGRPANHLR